VYKGILWETNEFASADSQSDSMRLECMDFFGVPAALIETCGPVRVLCIIMEGKYIKT
jgi:hypothetical protein